MPGQIVIRSSQMGHRQSPLTGTSLAGTLTPERSRNNSISNVGELAGGTAANCVVASCCCPCVVVEFIILAVYKVPASIFRRLWRKKRQKVLLKKKKKGLLEEAKDENGGRVLSSVGEVYGNDCVGYVDEVSDFDWLKEFEMVKVSVDGSAVELDKQMWDQFCNTGFWRSPSQRFT